MTNNLTISNTLKDLGISAKLLGYDYIREAVRLTLDDKSFVHNITKRLYPAIAKIYNTTPSRVERAIRHAIEIAWYRGNETLQLRLFRFSISSDKGKPTNLEFIATVVDYLEMMSETL